MGPSAPITDSDEKAGTYSRVELPYDEERRHDVVKSGTRAELDGSMMAHELDGGYKGS
jgi:hypothetical protein